MNADKKGIVNDNNRYMAHLHPLFGDKEPREVTPFEVDRLRLAMLKGKAAAPGRQIRPEREAEGGLLGEEEKGTRGEGGEAGEETLRGRDRRFRALPPPADCILRRGSAAVRGALLQGDDPEGREAENGGHDRGADGAVHPDVPGVAGSRRRGTSSFSRSTPGCGDPKSGT